MRALMVDVHGGPEVLQYREVADPEVGAGQVMVDVRAAGVNFPDLLVTQGRYQFSPPLPFSPGSEVAGVVSAVGEGVTSRKVGDRVTGMAMWGGFAERVVLGETQVTPLPEEVPFEIGAVLTTTYGTVLHALEDRARLRSGEVVLVLGAAGGVGTASIELAKLMGARVIAAASGASKLQACQQLGADHTIDYAEEDLKERAKALSAGGVDVVVDAVGGVHAEPALRAMAWDGRFLVVGFAAGDIPRVPLNLVLLKGCSIVGVFWGAFIKRDPKRGGAQLARIARWVAEGKLSPLVSKTYRLSEGAEALRAIAARAVRGKVVLVP